MDSAAVAADDDLKCQGCKDILMSKRFNAPHRKLPYHARFRQIQTWLRRCLQDHPECSWGETSAQLPTRVLDLDLQDGSADIRLIDGNGKHEKYATLTYRWGPSPENIFKTTSANLQQNQSRIEIASPSFNNLFRDTVNFVRSLGIRYLWIDALCIIQYDHADWLAEASKMAMVYSGAYVTISASVSTSPEDRLLAYNDFLQPDLGPSSMYYEVNNGSLGKRGWCLQERCLSRRIIHFGDDQIHWECSRATLSEHLRLLTKPPEEHVLDPSSRLLLGPLAFRSRTGLEPELQCIGGPLSPQEGDSYSKWYDIMGDYTERTLTQESDTVPALLGLINVFMAATGDRMHMPSGLWRGDLAFGLLWRQQYGGRSSRDLRKACIPAAPSWSWLSVPGVVNW